MQLSDRQKVKSLMMSEIEASLMTIVAVTLIVAFIFSFIYRIEKRKRNLRLGEIIKNVLKKLS